MAEGHHLVVAEIGKIKTRLQSEVEFTEIGVPTNVSVRNCRPRFAKFRRLTVIVGRHNPGSIYSDALDEAWRLGIPKPGSAPTNAASGVGITGEVITYYVYMHWEGSVLIHQGNLSPASATFSAVNQGVTVTLPGTAPLDRITHIGVYASVDGDIPKYVDKVTLGTTTFTWNGPVSGRGNTIPVNADGTINTDARGEPPDATMTATYGDRTWYNSITYPERGYYSLIDEPESVGPNAYIPTKGREAITGMLGTDDQLLMLCLECGYDVQGYSAGGANPDFKMRRISGSIGCISHDSLTVVYNRPHWASKFGPVDYPGGGAEPRLLIDDRMGTFWREDYEANRAAYEDCQGAFETEHQGYRLLIPLGNSFNYILSYATGGRSSLPEVYFLMRDRYDGAIGNLWLPNSGRSVFYVGGADGFLRKENQYDDATDDDDTGQKTLTIQPKHFFLPDQAGNRFHGAMLHVAQFFIRVRQAFSVEFYMGDDMAGTGEPTWGPYNFPAVGGASDSIGPIVDDTSTYPIPVRLGGQGVTAVLRIPNAMDFEYRGLTLVHGQGPRARTRA